MIRLNLILKKINKTIFYIIIKFKRKSQTSKLKNSKKFKILNKPWSVLLNKWKNKKNKRNCKVFEYISNIKSFKIFFTIFGLIWKYKFL
jgi:hypothetical protein